MIPRHPVTRREFGRMVGLAVAAPGLVVAAPADVDSLEPFAKGAKRYKFTLETDPRRDLTLVEEPVLKWTNPLRKTGDSAVFVWTTSGRPAVIASFYRYVDQGELREDHEFQSLATAGLIGLRDGRRVWSPPTAGVDLRALPGAPAPADSPMARLRQMRAQARDFKAFLDWNEKTVDLRLLTNPIFRDASTVDEVVDGALFAFAETTDPEVILLLEARRPRAEAAPVWHYALARSSRMNLRAHYQGREVWRVDWPNDLTAPSQPYITIPAPPPA
jgi:hypothetical protein